MTAKITGVLPALVTPFDEFGNIVAGSADKLLEKYLREKAGGLYMLGFTGEGRVMTVSERKQWTEIVLKTAGGQLPVIVHVGYSTVSDALELAGHAARHGAYAVSSVPLTDSATMQDNAAYFRRLAQASELPFYIYWNQEIIDRDTGRRPAPDKLAEEVLSIPNLKGIKYTDTHFDYLERIRKYKPELNLLTGVDTMVNAGALLGADGSIGALQSVTCGHMRKMWEAYHAGDIRRAQELQTQANNVYEMLDRPEIGVIPGIKAILEREGIKGAPKLPTPPLTDQAALQQLLRVYEENIDNTL